MRFPPHAVREVEVRLSRPSCMGGTAFVTVDVEPLPEDAVGFEFHDAADWADIVDVGTPTDELRECARATGEGLLIGLAGGHDGRVTLQTPETVRGLRFAFPPTEAAPGTFAEALSRGFPLLGEPGRPLIAARVVVYRLRYHPIDSAPHVFHRAGLRAAQETLRRVNGPSGAGDREERRAGGTANRGGKRPR